MPVNDGALAAAIAASAANTHPWMQAQHRQVLEYFEHRQAFSPATSIPLAAFDVELEEVLYDMIDDGLVEVVATDRCYLDRQTLLQRVQDDERSAERLNRVLLRYVVPVLVIVLIAVGVALAL
ncbi:hypothetical protein C1932_00080 [Stenotrophomonas sp. YAU14D1_LEIMI4_1]|nr:hypothetical protein C1932_00080 [Stenotrophomonas sp. YAU14D1_LEIMI4_1]